MDDLAKQLARGDPNAFADLYDALADRLHHYLTVRLGSRPDADDILQETFVRLARARKQLATVSNPTSYVFAIARNESSRLLEARRRRGEVPMALTAETLFDDAAANDARRREAADLIAAAMTALGPGQREVVELKAFAGLTFREIGELLDEPLGTVATRYRTAIEKMRPTVARELE